MSKKFSLLVDAHRAFGALATLRLAGQAERRFTLAEARHVAAALDALAAGVAREGGVYMSPIASDWDFDASATSEGLLVASPSGGAGLALEWPEVAALAATLRRAAEGALSD
jgi:hypothetical protein